MQVGDLIRIKYDGVVTLIVEVVLNPGDIDPHGWFHLLDQPVPFRADKLEVVNESR